MPKPAAEAHFCLPPLGPAKQMPADVPTLLSMKNSLLIGRLAGIRIFLHWTFLLLLGFLVFAEVRRGSSAGAVLASVGFAWYAQNFGNYDASYGSIGAFIVLMLWLYIAGLAILFGSEINALIEHHSPDGKDKGEHAEGENGQRPSSVARAA